MVTRRSGADQAQAWAVFVAAAMAFSGAARAAPPAAASWLDVPAPAAWNLPGVPVPPAVRQEGTPIDERCLAQLRTPSPSPADTAVIAAGWMLVGPLQVFGGTEVVTAASAFDGMCRPLGYQAFVFVGGTFAGTLSPGAMAARTDGMAGSVRLVATDRLYVEYARYADSDPLCCPSATTSVTFEVRPVDGAAVVVPAQARFQAVDLK